MTNTSIPSVIADDERVLEEFPQIRDVLPAWPEKVSLLEYDESSNLPRFYFTREIGDVVELWGSGEVRPGGTVHLDEGPDILFPKNGEITNTSEEEALQRAREIAASLETVIEMLEQAMVSRHPDVQMHSQEEDVIDTEVADQDGSEFGEREV